MFTPGKNRVGRHANHDTHVEHLAQQHKGQCLPSRRFAKGKECTRQSIGHLSVKVQAYAHGTRVRC